MTPRLPLRTKLLYGAGEFAVSAKNAALGQFLLFFYVDIVQVSPALVGTALFLGRFWDAVTDPVAGYVSDTTRTRWGRRRPFVLAAAVPMAIAFYLLFTPPQWSELGVFAYVVCTYLTAMTLFTLYATPYLAWGAELTSDYHERTAVVQTRALFGVIGAIAGAAAPVAIANRFREARSGYAAAAAVLAVVMAVAGLCAGLGVKECDQASPPRPSLGHFVQGLKRTFANYDFRRIFAVFCGMTLAGSLGNAVQLFVIKYWLELYEWFPYIALAFGGAFVASFPVWTRLSRYVGKHRALTYGVSLGCVVPWGWFIVPPGNVTAMLLFAGAGGFATGSVTLAMSSAIDVIDWDELQTGERREGAYFGVWTLGLKTMGAAGALLGGWCLALLGTDPVAGVDATTAWRLLWVVGPLQVTANAVGLVFLRGLRWGRAEVASVQAILAQKRQQRSA